MSLVITADFRGFRIRESTDYKECVYVLDDGMTVSTDRCWPATLNNVVMAGQLYATKQIDRAKKELRSMEQAYDMSAEAAEIFLVLKKQGFTLDEETRIRTLMQPPFTEVQEDDIVPLIMSHVDKCEKIKKDPANVPLAFGWVEPEPGKGTIVFEHEGKLAAGKHAGGVISLFNKRQVILSFQDWHLIPKGSSVGTLVQFLKCEPTGAKSIKELCGKHRAVVEDGVLITTGLKKLVFTDISIDQFL